MMMMIMSANGLATGLFLLDLYRQQARPASICPTRWRGMACPPRWACRDLVFA
jgi:hypothetical protein